MNYILASNSPRRKELMGLICETFDTQAADIEEIVPKGIDIYSAPEYLAKKKALYVFEKNPESIVIGADTAVLYGGEMLGKPKDESDAYSMISKLSGKTHEVVTGCAVFGAEKHTSFSCVTKVTFFKLSDSEIYRYIKTGEPMDKAGAYGIQGRGALFVKEISGDYFNVVGLPVSLLARRLLKFEEETVRR